MKRHGSGRLPSLDALRGLAVAGMIVVNAPGSDVTFTFLRHSTWHGCTLADLVFPVFLAAVGASVVLALARRLEQGASVRELARGALLRACALMALGLLVSVFDVGGEVLRWPGVLQRVALCYLACVALCLTSGPRCWAATAAAALLGYATLLSWTGAPGCPPGALTPACALPAWLDRVLLGDHLLGSVDPEGLLSTVPAAATAVLGMLAARVLRPGRGAAAIGVFGALLAAAGLAWSSMLPFNKHLWTSSFALFSAGVALLLLAALHAWLARRERALAPLRALGRHALAVYVLSGALYGLLEFLPAPGQPDLKLWLTRRLLEPVLEPRWASLAFALAFLAAWTAALTRSEAPRSARGGRPYGPARTRRPRPSPRRTRRPGSPIPA